MKLKILQSETGRKVASEEAKQLKDYIDKMIEHNSTCKTSYSEITALFKDNNNTKNDHNNESSNIIFPSTSELKNL